MLRRRLNLIQDNIISKTFYNKDKVLNTINKRKLNPTSIIQNKANEIFFKNTGYAHPILGYKKNIENLNTEALRNHLDLIINQKSIEINIVGDINENSSANLISNLFKGIPQGRYVDKEKFILNYKKRRQLINIPHGSKQTHIAIYTPSITRLDKNFYNILVANYIFGGSGFGNYIPWNAAASVVKTELEMLFFLTE